MSYRKFKADYLFTGRVLLKENPVLITDEKGVIADIVDNDHAGDNVEYYEGLITPGFVNSHCHLELSHMKGHIPPGLRLVKFLTQVITQRNAAEEFIVDAMKDAEQELYDSGTVAVGDICNAAHSVAVKKTSRIAWKNFIEVTGLNPDTAMDRLNHGQSLLAAFESEQIPSAQRVKRPSVSLSPHAPYSVSRRLFTLIDEASSGEIISIHNQESEDENLLFQDKSGDLLLLYDTLNIDHSSFKASGRTSIQTYLPWLSRPSGIILVHNTFLGEEDISFVASNTNPHTKLFFCLCINANRYIEGKDPPVELLKKHDCVICIGTDSYASNTRLNMLHEIKSIQNSFSSLVSIEEILQWATLNGALAVGMGDELGSFDKGKKPGVVVIDKFRDDWIDPNASSRRIV